MPDERKKDRYALRADGPGWTVYEVWSGNPAVVAGDDGLGIGRIDPQLLRIVAAGVARDGKDEKGPQRR